MDSLITLAEFDNAFEVKYNLLKDMLDQSGIRYIAINENARSAEPMAYMTPSNISIEIKIFEYDLEQAQKIFESIS
ncbi:hypothetical protein [Ancylomarina sp.]|uniref:hypothetical protein n=1 Tax=Ancylomarina sp. TaxID=1970196 RepID=UPI00356929FC